MPGVGQAQPAAATEAQHAEHHGHEHGGREVAVEKPVQPADDFSRSVQLPRGGAQERTNHDHEQGPRDAFPRHVADGEADSTGHGDEVVEIPAHALGRLQGRADLYPGQVGQGRREEAELDFARRLQLVTELLNPLDREPLPQHAHERPEGTHLLAPPEKGPDAHQELLGHERLGHVVVGPPLQPLHPILDLGLLREHDHGDLGGLGVLAE